MRNRSNRNCNATKSGDDVSISVELFRSRRRRRHFALACALVWLAAPGVGAETECPAIADDAERLACYDAKYGVRRAPPAVEQPPAVAAERTPTPAAAEPAVTASALDVVPDVVREPPATIDEQGAVTGAATRTPATDEAGAAAGPVSRASSVAETRAIPRPSQEAPAPRSGTGVVADVRERWPDARLVFTLADGRRWVQTKAQRVAIGVGDRVTLKARRFGQHLMVGPGGATTRVQPLGGEAKRG